jgi:hypothetical protein
MHISKKISNFVSVKHWMYIYIRIFTNRNLFLLFIIILFFGIFAERIVM